MDEVSVTRPDPSPGSQDQEPNGMESGLEIAAVLAMLQDVPPPSPAAIAAARRAFLEEGARLRTARQGQSPSLLARIRRVEWGAWWRGPSMEARPRGRPVLFGRAVRLALVGLLIVAVVAGTVATAQSAGPGSPLYGVKLLWEDIRVELTLNPRTRAELALHLAEVRTEEMVALALAGRTAPPSLLDRQAGLLRLALHSAALLPDEGLRQVLELTRSRVSAQRLSIEKATFEIPGQFVAPLQQAIDFLGGIAESAELGLSDPDAFRQAELTGAGALPTPWSTAVQAPEPTATLEPLPSSTPVLPVETTPSHRPITAPTQTPVPLPPQDQTRPAGSGPTARRGTDAPSPEKGPEATAQPPHTLRPSHTPRPTHTPRP